MFDVSNFPAEARRRREENPKPELISVLGIRIADFIQSASASAVAAWADLTTAANFSSVALGDLSLAETDDSDSRRGNRNKIEFAPI
jgi:hypothetical protein